ncbi:DinB family protein [Neorhodopirellula lusitana]|uniref:DinB family protein n=1 Tax=Neorhodopirellula lusitana TaxID=445327 RepID=UPI0038503885
MTAELKTMQNLFTMMNGMLTQMISEIDDDRFDEPLGEGNSPNWIVGHLALGMEFAVSLLGGESEVLGDLMPVYGPGSPGGRIGDTGRSKEELLELLERGFDRVNEALANVKPGQLEQPQKTTILEGPLPTVGDMLGHLLTTHFGMHIGQLSAWRRATGMESILKLG